MPATMSSTGAEIPQSVKKRYECTQCGKELLRFPSRARSRVLFCNRTCLGAYRSIHATGANAPGWNGGLHRGGKYISVYAPWAACADADGYAYLHRLIMEVHLGQPIPEGMVVHHKDHDRANNAPDNLELMSLQDHAQLHGREWRKATAQRTA